MADLLMTRGAGDRQGHRPARRPAGGRAVRRVTAGAGVARGRRRVLDRAAVTRGAGARRRRLVRLVAGRALAVAALGDHAHAAVAVGAGAHVGPGEAVRLVAGRALVVPGEQRPLADRLLLLRGVAGDAAGAGGQGRLVGAVAVETGVGRQGLRAVLAALGDLIGVALGAGTRLERRRLVGAVAAPAVLALVRADRGHERPLGLVVAAHARPRPGRRVRGVAVTVEAGRPRRAQPVGGVGLVQRRADVVVATIADVGRRRREAVVVAVATGDAAVGDVDDVARARPREQPRRRHRRTAVVRLRRRAAGDGDHRARQRRGVPAGLRDPPPPDHQRAPPGS
ncbi:MAG: hypothetical protein HS111_14260 [Kofleriaceae bacterium]|nr:hypothetical protein [Kofleriaceae bacterium]